MSRVLTLWLLAAALGLAAVAVPAAAALPPISPVDWAATAPASDPKASMLVLWKRAEYKLRDLTKQQVSSSLHLEQRIKVLTPEGLHGGELEIVHGRELRLQSLSGRTLLPDGKILPLEGSARFERRLSQRQKTWVTAVAFPGVAVGSIIEYEADLRFDSFLLLEPWYLSESSPVLYSEVVFDVPKSLQGGTWGRDPFGAGLQTEKTQSVVGTRLRAWARNLPAVPVEPLAPPFADLATQYGFITTAYSDADVLLRLFESWPSTCKFVDERHYDPARRKDRGVKAKARDLTAGARDPRAQAEALYRFVRDAIHTERLQGVTLRTDAALETVLSSASGSYAEKGLLLQSMLDDIGIRSHLVWANERSTGLVTIEVPSPAWFERVLVAADLPQGRVFLEPSEAIPFGSLPAEVEGGQAVLFDVKKPEIITLPSLSPEQNRRRAALALAIDAEGRVGGTGELLLTGQHAATALRDADPALLGEHWKKWLGDRFTGFRLDGVEATPDRERGELRVRFKLTQSDDEALGDEVTLVPSRPLGPLHQPLALATSQRRTPVVLPFADRDEVELELTFPAGWRVEAMPQALEVGSEAGTIEIKAEVDEGRHTVRYHRRVDVGLRESHSRDGYAQLKAFYAIVEKQDAQAMALARH